MKTIEKEIFKLEEFHELLENHVWSFTMQYNETSYMRFINAVREEGRLLNIAVKHGMQHVDAYYNVQHGVRQKMIRQCVDDAVKKTQSQYRAMIPTGNADFDSFRERCENLDWYTDYSDDHNVWKHGKKNREALETEAKTKGGIYQTFFDHIKKRKFST